MRALLALSMMLACIPEIQASSIDGLMRVEVEHFIDLPRDVRHPEGLAVDPVRREIYVGTFDARTPENLRNNQLLRFSAEGTLLARRRFDAAPLTGIEFNRGKIYILNFGASKLQRIVADFDDKSAIEDVAVFKSLAPAALAPRQIANPDGSLDEIRFGSNGLPAINGMTFDRGGNLYVSDSFQGAIYRIKNATTCSPCEVATISRDPLLATSGALPFGANGLALNGDESVLYINNAGDGRVLQMRLPDGPVTILAESIHGADGLMRYKGLLWVASNQADVIVGLDESGRERVRAGEFRGIGKDGAPLGLLFPAGTAALEEWMIVANLALPLTSRSGDEWEEEVTRWTLSRFRIPASP
jgi:DNA-binding beta-propeller fold protein YncE